MNYNERQLNIEDAVLKVLKLPDGTNIVGLCFFFDKEDYMIIAQPLVIHYVIDFEKENTTLNLYPWLPIEIASENAVELKLKDIVTSFYTTNEFTNEYFKFLERLENIISNESEEVNSYTGIRH